MENNHGLRRIYFCTISYRRNFCCNRFYYRCYSHSDITRSNTYHNRSDSTQKAQNSLKSTFYTCSNLYMLFNNCNFHHADCCYAAFQPFFNSCRIDVVYIPNRSAASGSLSIAKSAKLILPFIRRAGGQTSSALAFAFFQLLVDKRLCLL